MPVRCSDWGKEERYAGCVLSWHEHNGYDDSDWDAVVWDEASQKVIEVNYMTTRAACSGIAIIDATPEVVRKVYRYYHRCCKDAFEVINNQEARKPDVGKVCKVIRGRKVPIGTVSKVMWMTTEVNPFSHLKQTICGVVCNDTQYKNQAVPADYLEVQDWQQYLLHGKLRKQTIRRMALLHVPRHLHHMLIPAKTEPALKEVI